VEEEEEEDRRTQTKESVRGEGQREEWRRERKKRTS